MTKHKKMSKSELEHVKAAYKLSIQIRGDWSDCDQIEEWLYDMQRHALEALHTYAHCGSGKDTEHFAGLLQYIANWSDEDLCEDGRYIRDLWPEFEEILEYHGALEDEEEEA